MGSSMITSIGDFYEKTYVVLVFATLAAGGAFGQTWYNSYAPGIEGSKIFINGGIGFGVLPYKMSLPPSRQASSMGCLIYHCLSAGILALSVMTRNLAHLVSYKRTMMGFGAKASYHFNFLKNLNLVLG
jgi:hypothetical protein